MAVHSVLLLVRVYMESAHRESLKGAEKLDFWKEIRAAIAKRLQSSC
jgi:hypothetical protein